MPGDVWALIGMLAVVVLILVLAHWATKWIGAYSMKSSGGKLRTGGGGAFCVLGQLSLGRTGQLLLVRLQGHCFLLGVTAEQITLLKELDADEAREWIEENDAAPAAPGFMDVLKENLRKRK